MSPEEKIKYIDTYCWSFLKRTPQAAGASPDKRYLNHLPGMTRYLMGHPNFSLYPGPFRIVWTDTYLGEHLETYHRHINFEEVLDNVNEEIQVQLLFHLDLFL